MNHPTSLENEAKALVALAFRNGPIEQIHAGKACPTCHGNKGYSHITNLEMKVIMQYAVNTLHRLLVLKATDPACYEAQIALGSQYTKSWDRPD